MKNRKQEYDKWNKKRANWLKDGKCRACGRDKLNNNKLCLKCYLISVSAERLGTGKYWKDLLTLMENQNFTCVLTGDKLSWDSDIELDHIIPESRGGKKELNNVRWVTKMANRVKQNLIDGELFEICQKILTYSKIQTRLKP